MTQPAHRTTLTSTSLTAFMVLSVAVLVMASCTGGPIPPTSTTGPTLPGPGGGREATPIGGTGTLKLMLTDAPIDEVEKVNIFFTSVTVKPAGKPVEELPLNLAVNPVDLLTLQGTVTDFAGGLVPAGDYEFIHINIDESLSSIVVGGVEKSLQIPSEEIKILGTFTVGGPGVTTLTLDFDAQRSLLLRGNGEWLMKPVIVVLGGNGGTGENGEGGTPQP